MIYSKTSEYAIRALTHFARTRETRALTVREVSRATHIPQAYVAKIFQCLVKKKILRSKTGPSGGFVLEVDLDKLSILQVVSAVDNFPGSPFSDCVMGLKECSDRKPCLLHGVWARARREIHRILSTSTFSDLAHQSMEFGTRKKKKATLSRSMRNLFATD